MNLRIVALGVLLGVALMVGSNVLPAPVAPVQNAAASCDIKIDDGCANVCHAVVGVLDRVDPDHGIYCFD